MLNPVFLARSNKICKQCRKTLATVTVDKQYTKSKYSNTCQLPKTDFPAWVKPSKRVYLDENIIKTCGFKELYSWQRENLAGEEFALHDGPPYANGVPHMGHAINKILKDIITRNNVIIGRKVHYKPGWDCHGLPIELKAIGADDKNSSDPLYIRKKAKAFAQRAIVDQKSVFRSWGIMADMDKECYHTFERSYIANELRQFYALHEKGLVYRDLKPVYWSPSSRTALAEAELEYNDAHQSTAVTVRMKCKSNGRLSNFENLHALIWTTTPWTLPSNQAITYNPNLEYSVVNTLADPDFNYIVCTALIPKLKETLGELRVVSSIPGSDLEGIHYEHCFDQNVLPFLPGSHVTSEAGTGLVHTAPAHGPDDFLISLQFNMPVKCFVDEKGNYTSEMKELSGLNVLKDGNTEVIKILKSHILHQETLVHSYPYDWRTKEPVILRASQQWFIDTNLLKEKALEAVKNVEIIPNRGVSGLTSKIEKRPYWCISRQRVWGVPIPVLYDGDKPVISKELIEHYCQLLEKNGPDFWWSSDIKELAPAHLVSKSSDSLCKGKDIFDVWFDSGLSWSAVLEGKVADVYLEGIDQFTGWFQSSLLTSIALENRAPYKKIFVHGFVVDEQGRKMSKSLGNVVNPQDIIHGESNFCKHPYGVDVLRWWVAAHGTQHSSVPVGHATLNDCVESLKKIRNQLKFFLGNINDLTSGVPHNLRMIDQYMLYLLHDFQQQALEFYSLYQFNKVCFLVLNFITSSVSAFYCHSVKDRLYCDEADSIKRRAAQYVMLQLLDGLMYVLAPILPVLVEEVYSYHPLNQGHSPYFYQNHHQVNVHHLDNRILVNSILEQALAVKAVVLKESPINANKFQLRATVRASPMVFMFLKQLQKNEDDSYTSELAEILQVAYVHLMLDRKQTSFSVDIEIAKQFICGRCRKFTAASDGCLCDRCSKVLSAAV